MEEYRRQVPPVRKERAHEEGMSANEAKASKLPNLDHESSDHLMNDAAVCSLL